MLKPLDPSFTILGFKEVEPKPDGTLRRNRWVISVEVSGVVHRVFIRRSTNKVHIPLPLESYPYVTKVKRAVSDLMAPMIEAARQAVK